MIDVKSLRIGNWIYCDSEINNKKNAVQVFSLEEYEGNIIFGYYTWGEKYYSNGIEPIPLSEELLLKIGIKQDKNDKDKFRIGGGYQVIRHDGKWLFRVIGCTLNEVPYLHKLQNIYYEIEGEELQINL